MEEKTIDPSVLPFDRPFLLEIKSKSYKLEDKMDIYEVKIRRGRKYLGKSYKRNSENIIIEPFHQENINVIKVKDGEYRATIPYLLPNKSYDLVFSKKLSLKELNLFFKYYDNEKKGTPDKDLEDFYYNQIQGLEAIGEDSPYERFYFDDKPIAFGNIETTFDEFKSQQYPQLKKILDGLLKNLHDYDKSTPSIDDIQMLGKYVREYKADVATHALLFDLIDGKKVKDYVLGFKAIGEKNIKAIDENDFIKRKTNIDKNQRILDSIDKQVIKLITLEETTNIAEKFRESYLDELKKTMNWNKKQFDDSFEKIEKLLNPDFSFVELVSASSINSEMKTNNGQIIVPDFGLINILGFQNDGTTQYIPRPSAGINFHFGGGIDRNKRIRNIPVESRKRFWLKSSVALGVTLGKIDEGGFTDFYNGFSPYVGYNFRLEDQIRIGAGMILLREADTNPVVNKNRVEPAIYMNLTFDFNLFSTLGNAASKIIGL
ncbi:hypothetical protein [Flagellimonas sp. 2504JD1-5]